MCFIYTCKPEGFGNNFIQAWNQGCSTISLEYDPDNLIQEKSLVFLSGNIKQMTIDLEKLIKNNNLRNEIEERAKNFAQKNFTPGRMINEIEDFLKEILRKNE